MSMTDDHRDMQQMIAKALINVAARGNDTNTKYEYWKCPIILKPMKGFSFQFDGGHAFVTDSVFSHRLFVNGIELSLVGSVLVRQLRDELKWKTRLFKLEYYKSEDLNEIARTLKDYWLTGTIKYL